MIHDGTDRTILYGAAFMRALATGMVGVLIGIYLADRGFDSAAIGFVVSAGLAGAALGALLVTLLADRVGRRRVLVTLGLLGCAGGLLVIAADGLLAISAAAFLGMLNGMGRDRGAALIIDQVILPATATDAERTKIFAWYNVLQDAGHALGGLAAGLPVVLRGWVALDEAQSLRATMLLYAGLHLAIAATYSRLSPACESHGGVKRAPLSAQSRRILVRISALFALDSVAGGFLTAALLSFFFFERFGASGARSASCSSVRASRTPDRTSARLGSPSASGSSTRWSSPTSRRAFCSPP